MRPSTPTSSTVANGSGSASAWSTCVPETIEKYPAQLSGGMRKRVGIARAIAGAPKYLLYDEPTSGLDPVNADIIDSLVQRLDDELGVTSVMVTHDVRGRVSRGGQTGPSE